MVVVVVVGESWGRNDTVDREGCKFHKGDLTDGRKG